MLVVPLIERKRDGGALTPEEWSALVAAYTDGRIPDYQMSALLMAVLLRGLERQELAALTDAMLASGQRLAFDSWATPRVDKHSTGGVGDKVSLVLAPLVAACGVAVPMMSGRGLGHTGGTLDSLNYQALWKSGRELVDIAKQITGNDDSSKHLRDSLYTEARVLGEAAVRVNPNGADGHFTIGQALGRLSRTKGGKERVRFAKIIYDEGMKAIELDSTHDGACHLIGAWHAEVKRLS